MEHWNSSYEAISKRTLNCTEYFHTIPALFQNVDVTTFEEDALKDILHKGGNNSIGFNIMVHSQPGIIEIFLALYFRPDNHYVIHLDKKVKTCSF